jgi:beta-glucanase (GH16 family)/GT2 family glycosyltransferase
VRILDLGEPLTDLRLPPARAGGVYRSLLVIGRVDGDPVGSAVIPVEEDGSVPADRLADELDKQLRVELSERVASEPVRDGRSVSVVVTTCNEPVRLRRCLHSVLASDHDDFNVVVVENRPGSPDTRLMLGEEFGDDPRLRYVEEPNRGLSSARNAGLAAATGDVVAFTDDDVVVDPAWVRRTAEAFERGDDVACVTGLILPFELESESQVLVEQFMALGKGFRRHTFRLPDARETLPLLPYTPGVIGSGANTALRADVARELGGFSTTLGTGTPAAGGEDLDLYIRLLRAGHAVAYEPAAIVWHTHPEGSAKLRRQVYRYGVSLGATLTKQLVAGPERRELLQAVPAGIRYARDKGSPKNAGKTAGYPRRLDWLERLGMLAGPLAYLTSLLQSVRDPLPPSHAGANGNGHMPAAERLVLVSGQALPVVDAAQRPPAGARELAKSIASPSERALTATAVAACVAAPLLVAVGAPPVARFAAVLALLCLAPGTALIAALRGRTELGLVLGASLGISTVLAQSMVSLDLWWPRAYLYGVAAACLLVLVTRLDIARPRPPRALLSRARGALAKAPPSAGRHAALLTVAMLAWVASLAGADLNRMAGLGLLDAMPPTYFVAFALLLIGFAVAVTRDELQPKLLALYVVALILVIHGTTPLLYDQPRYAWTYKHLAVIDLLKHGGGVDRQVDIYNNWPGFFALNAWLSTVSGLDARTYAEWAQVFFNLANVVALRFALRGVTSNERVLWVAPWLFLLANWVGQDYLAPQAFAFLLAIVFFGLVLRTRHGLVEPRSRAGRWWASRLDRIREAVLRRSPIEEPLAPPLLSPRAAVVVGAPMYLAMVVSHQLTPLVVLVGVAGLALFTRRVPIWIPAVMAVVELWWVALGWSYVHEHFLLFHVDPSAGAGPPGYRIGAGLPGLDLVGYASAAEVLLLTGLAAAGIAGRIRAARWELAAVTLAVAAVPVIALQAYSGEGRYRLFLFALPWLAFFAAAAFAPPRSRQLTRSKRGWQLGLASTALAVCLLPAYFGLELANRVTGGEVAAGAWFDEHAPSGSLAVEMTSNSLSRVSGGYARVFDVRFASGPTLTRDASYRNRKLGRKDLPRLEGTLAGYGAKHTFLLLNPSQERFARLYGILPGGWLQSLERALDSSPAFRLVYRRDSSSIYKYQPPPARKRDDSLVWGDEFEGRAGAPPDRRRWSLEAGGNWTGELQAYTRRVANASLDGRGHLAITARRERYTGPDGVTSNYTSARLNTRKKLEFAYGRLKARIRIPDGRGIHPAFWALGSNYGSVGWPASGEIDVMEVDGSNPARVSGTLHGPGGGDAGYFLRAHRRMPAPVSRGFHEYGMSWSPGKIVVTVDGRPYGRFVRGDQPRGLPWTYDHPFFLLFTLAVRDQGTGQPDANTPWPATMLVDWVRVWRGRATYCSRATPGSLGGRCPERPPRRGREGARGAP